MALFMIERRFAEELNPEASDIKSIGEVNDQCGVRWLYSFLSADRRKTYCLYEADTADAIREAAENAGLPANVIVELSGELRPETFSD